MELSSNEVTVVDEAPQALTAPCGRCGCPVEADDKFCPACGSPRPEEAVAAGVAEVSKQTASEEAADQQRYFRCKNCGAEVATDPEHRSYVCPFCDSTYVMEFSPEPGRHDVEFVIGFAVTPDQALERFHQWIKENSWYRPGDLHLAEVAEKLRGVYLPFWSFSMLARSRWSASIGEHWWETETYTTIENGKTVTKTRRVQRTEWWPLDGRHHRYYSGYLISGSRGLPQGQADRIKPFHLSALKRYAPYFLAGWMCEEYSVQREEAEHYCRQVFQQWEERNISSFMPGDTHRSLEAQTQFSHVNSDLILLPIYLLSYRHQDKLYRFLVNGQTGKINGDKPVSWKRIGTLAGVLIAILVAIGVAVAIFNR